MKINWEQQDIFRSGVVLILILVIGRYLAGGFDFSWFISAGSDFVDAKKIPTEIIISSNQGYDGQFFYRLALNPFDFSQTAYGVTFDYPEYRAQRIVYPFLAWVFSFGGIPFLVPFTLVLVNILSFIGTIFFYRKIVLVFNRELKLHLLIFFIFGMYLSVAKDLSEVTELFFFTGAIWFMIDKRWWLYTCFATLTLLTRETSLIAIIPLTIFILIRNKPLPLQVIIKTLIPFIGLLLWKIFVHYQTGNLNRFDGTGNFGLPFSGILPGLKANLDISTPIKILQLVFWIAYFLWQLWFIKIVILQIIKSGNFTVNPFIWMYVCWFCFAIFLSESIYMDDWSFVRVFGLWNMTGMMVLSSIGVAPGNRFYIYSAFLLSLTVIRLIIK